MIFLQIQNVTEQSAIQTNFLQYGVLGVFTMLLLWAIIYYEKKRTAREKEQSERILSLEQRFDEYQKTDRVRMEDLIQKNIQVMNEVLKKLDK